MTSEERAKARRIGYWTAYLLLIVAASLIASWAYRPETHWARFVLFGLSLFTIHLHGRTYNEMRSTCAALNAMEEK